MILMTVSCIVAEQVVARFDHPLAKVCPLHLASSQTKQTARKSRGFLFVLLLVASTVGYFYCWNSFVVLPQYYYLWFPFNCRFSR